MAANSNEATMSQEQELVITRTFKAPRELVFRACTQAEHLQHWWGPTGFTLSVVSLDVRPGGRFHYGMSSPDGNKMWGLFVYRDVVAPERITFVSSFADGDGNLIPAPFFPVWPLEVLNTWTLTEDNGQTTLTLRGGPINASDEERQAFQQNHPSMQGGFKGTFDQLDDYLATLAR